MVNIRQFIKIILITGLFVKYNLLVGVTNSSPNKIVGLMQVRNEEIFIEQCLKALACYTDAMVILDDGSEDNTLKIIKKLAKKLHIEKIIEHKESAWQTKDERYNRQELLDAGRSIGGTHFILIDADEMFTSLCKKDNWLRKKILSLKKGQVMTFPMVNVWGSVHYYRDDADCSPYSERWRKVSAVLCDDGICNYLENTSYSWASRVIHVQREPADHLPKERIPITDLNYCLIHFKHLNLKNIIVKKIWYMCFEYIRAMQRSPELSSEHAALIKAFYSGYEFKGYLPGDPGIVLKKVPASWYQGYTFFNEQQLAQTNTVRKKEIQQWIKRYGPTYFAPLDIWQVSWTRKLQTASAA